MRESHSTGNDPADINRACKAELNKQNRFKCLKNDRTPLAWINVNYLPDNVLA